MPFVLIFIASQTTAQNGVRYPESFQITKNGTTVLLEDYAPTSVYPWTKDGELYLLSKTDGMIRKLTGIVTPPPSGPR